MAIVLPMNTREKGKTGEQLVQQYYQQQGFSLLKANFTVRGGEIDLVMKKDHMLVAIEVKNLDTIAELDNYITSRKMVYLQRALDAFLWEYGREQFTDIRLDAVFVKRGAIIEIYEDITNT
ncbi:MAG: YraN family protein [Candidatus Peribacteria bacterium]|jgi:putative endonuclease|nr:YraN family protein [Candidatus Peribacteria bacterium]